MMSIPPSNEERPPPDPEKEGRGEARCPCRLQGLPLGRTASNSRGLLHSEEDLLS